jgi:hypothetical protein
MRSSSRVLLAVLVSAAASSPARADTLVATTSHPTTISTYGGVTAWSEYVPDDGTYRLALRQNGKVTYPVIAKRQGPFDVTVGPDEKNKPVALYTRCAKPDGTVCDAYKYDIATKKERRVEEISSTTKDEAWPAQWKKNYAWVRHNFGGGNNSIEDRCDKAFWRPTKRELHIKSVSLAHGTCGVVTGQAFRSKTVTQTVLDVGSSNTSMIRTQSIDGGSPTVLSKKTSAHNTTNPSDAYISPVMDDKYMYATRIGTGHASSFVRVKRDKGTVSEVDAQTTLAGSIAHDKGVLMYVEVQAGATGGSCGPVTPCRIVTASANPFSSSSRDLLPRMSLTAPGEGLLGNQPLPVTGSLTVPTVKSGKIVGTHPLVGVALDILRADYSPTPTGQILHKTPVSSTTGPDGNWSLTVPPPVPVFGYYTAAATSPAGDAAQAPIVTLHTFAAISMQASPSTIISGDLVTFSGTVAPYQAGRAVDILEPLGGGYTTNIAQAPVNPDGSFSVKVNVTKAGTYFGELAANAADGSDGNATYTGKSNGVDIALK